MCATQYSASVMPDSFNLSIRICLARPAIFICLIEPNIITYYWTHTGYWNRLRSGPTVVCERHHCDHLVDHLWSNHSTLKSCSSVSLRADIKKCLYVGIPSYEFTLGFLDISCPVRVSPGARELGLPWTRSVSQHPPPLQLR
jgi:hypothetical protein